MKQENRQIAHHTRGLGGGVITRLMSPSDLGQIVKPFVFLDIFEAKGPVIQSMKEMPIHPHSGIATVTVFTEGAMLFNDPNQGSGEVGFGGVEFMQAGGGVWHGKEMVPANVSHIQGFQLWYALPPELENNAPVSRYISTGGLPENGPAKIVIGEYKGTKSPLPTNEGINYLLVTLKPGQKWQYEAPKGHSVAWIALAKGKLSAGESINSGEMVVFDQSENSIYLESVGESEAVFVLGSAEPHPHTLHMGSYSVHTSAEALNKGEARINELGIKLRQAGNRKTD